MRQFVPRLRKREFELIGILIETLGDRSIDGVHSKREVARQHYRGVDFVGSCASGTEAAAPPSLGTHCVAPAGLLVCSHSCPKRVSKKVLSHLVGLGVQAPSSPLEIVSPALPVP